MRQRETQTQRAKWMDVYLSQCVLSSLFVSICCAQEELHYDACGEKGHIGNLRTVLEFMPFQ